MSLAEKYGIDLSYAHKTACPRCRRNGNDRSGDNLTVYGSDSGAFCFACGFTIPSEAYKEAKGWVEEEEEVVTREALTKEEAASIKASTSLRGQNYRGIRDDISKQFGVRYEYDAETGEPCAQYVPTTINGELVGYRVRRFPKDFKGPIGQVGKEVELVGQFRFKKGGKTVVIVGGEVDMLSAYQMLSDATQRSNASKGTDYEPPAVVCSTLGESAAYKQVQAQYDWFCQFQKIIVCMDSDEPGQEAAEKVVAVLPPGKAFIMKMTHKDPNECLQAGKEKDFVSAYWNAKPYVPAGVKTAADAWDDLPDELGRARITLPPYMHRVQAMMGGGIRQGRIANVIADTSVGKCFTKGTNIMMADSTLKRVEDVEVGDKVMGADGSVRNVISLGRGQDEMYRIDQVSGISYTVNSEHILSLRASFDCPGSKVMKGDVVNIPVKEYLELGPKLKRSLKGYKAKFTKMGEGSVRLPYLIGLWLADGSTDAARITIGNKDIELKAYLKDVATKEGWELHVPPSADRSGCQTISISGGFRTLLSEFNLIGNKHIPDDYKFASYEDRKALLAGIVDGDGYVSNNCVEITQKLDIMRDDIEFLAKSLGYSVSCSTSIKKCQNFEGAPYHRIILSGDLDELPVLLPRRMIKKSSNRKTGNTSITVTPVGYGDYYGFTLDGDHLFCLEDFTVTHNTTHVRRMVYHWIFNSPVTPTVVSLEDTAGQYILDLISVHLEENFSWIRTESEILEWLDTEEGQRVKQELCFRSDGTPRFYIIDERGGSIKHIEEQMNVMYRKHGSLLFVIDVLTDLLRGSNADYGEDHMNFQKGFIKEGATIVNVHHTRKPTPDKEGKQRKATEYDALGTGSFVQSGAYNIVLNRDKLAEDPLVRNTTEVDMPKCRGGKTGSGGGWYYDFEKAKCYDLEDWIANNGPKEV